jgi:hypothetical protein
VKQGAHHYNGKNIGRSYRFLSKLGPLQAIRVKQWLAVFPQESLFFGKPKRKGKIALK